MQQKLMMISLLILFCVVHTINSSIHNLHYAIPGNHTLFAGGILRVDPTIIAYKYPSIQSMLSLDESLSNELYSLIKQQVNQYHTGNECPATLDNVTITKQEVLLHTSNQIYPSVLYQWNPVKNNIEPAPIYMGVNYYIDVNGTHELVIQRTAKNNIFVTKHLIHDTNTSVNDLSDHLTIRFMSLNIQNFQRSWRRRAEMIKEIVMEHERVDIIGIQEVRLDEERLFDLHQIDLLKYHLAELGFYYFVYQPAMSYINSFMRIPSRSEEGLAIFSRYPIVNTDHIMLTRNLSDHLSHQRIVLSARIRVANNLNVDFMTTHSSLTEGERDINHNDVEKYFNDHNVPKVLCGDFNAEPHENRIKKLVNDLTWKDTYLDALELGINVFNKTFSTDGRYDKRIDYIFTKQTEQIKCTTKHQEVIGKQHNYGYALLDTSDHYFLLADINFALSNN
jgi:endonuclease/exonuclease/phosphatase family metal-dependent hydrolase